MKPLILMKKKSQQKGSGECEVNAPSSDSGAFVVTIPAGEVSVSFTLQIVEDTNDEVDEIIVFSIASSSAVTAGDNPQRILTIIDNDILSIAFEKILYFGQEGDGDQRIKLRLSTPVATQQLITLRVFNGPGIIYPVGLHHNACRCQ